MNRYCEKIDFYPAKQSEHLDFPVVHEKSSEEFNCRQIFATHCHFICLDLRQSEFLLCGFANIEYNASQSNMKTCRRHSRCTRSTNASEVIIVICSVIVMPAVVLHYYYAAPINTWSFCVNNKLSPFVAGSHLLHLRIAVHRRQRISMRARKIFIIFNTR